MIHNGLISYLKNLYLITKSV